MTTTEKLPPRARLIFFTGALRELDQLSGLLDDISFEAGIEPPGHVVHYISGRREQLAASLARLRAEINPPEA